MATHATPSPTPYKLIIGRMLDRPADVTGQFLEARVRLKTARWRWNTSENAQVYGQMQIERDGPEFVVFIMLQSEADAVIFKLMHSFK